MKNNKIIKSIICVLIILFFCSCEDKKTEMFKMNTNPRLRVGFVTNFYIVSNPPEDIYDILLFYQNEVKKFSDNKGDRFLLNQKYYYQSYYKERYFFDRNFKESIPDYGRVLNFLDVFRDKYTVDTSHRDDLFITINFKDDNNREDAPISPYLFISEMNLYYFPKGLKNNPNIHWEKRRSKY